MKIKNFQTISENGITRVEEIPLRLVVEHINKPSTETYNEKTYWKQIVVLKDRDEDAEWIMNYQCEVSEAKKHLLVGVGEGDHVDVKLQLVGGNPKYNTQKDQWQVFNTVRILSLAVVRKASGQQVQHTPAHQHVPAQPQEQPKQQEPADDLPF